MTASDLVNVGISQESDEKLSDLKERGVFADKIDGYRFGVSLAIAQGAMPGELVKRVNLFNVGSLDPDQTLRRAIEALMPEALCETTPYRLIERLADWGVSELHAQELAGGVDFEALLGQVGSDAD